MNFGQALNALLNNSRSITRTGWHRQGMSLALQQPTGVVTEPFIVQHLANGDCSIYTPSQADILATDWGIAGEGAGQATGVAEHAGTSRG